MATQTTPATDSHSADGIEIDELVARAGDLKGELVAFAQGPRFARRLDALLFDAADRDGYLDEIRAVHVLDSFVLQYQLSDGRTVVERFVEQRRPQLPDDERELVLGWRDVVEGCFEVRGLDGDAVELHNLLDDLVYRAYSNLGREPFTRLRKRMFVIGRVVPLRPVTDVWLVSGHFVTYPKSARRQIAETAAAQLTAHPELLCRNPDMARRAWEMQAEHRADFIAQTGSDLIVRPPHEAQETLREHYRRVRRRAAKRKSEAAAEPAREELDLFPKELLEADSVGLVYGETEGLNCYRDFGRLDELFADPTLARDRSYLAQLRGYLDDESVSPLAIRRLVQRHPDGADRVFRRLLRKPGFSWTRDGEELLRARKRSYVDREPVPSVSFIGGRLAELLRTAR